MDFRVLSTVRKEMVGEYLGGNTVKNLVPRAKEIGKASTAGEIGIDGMFEVKHPDIDYVIVEYKYGSSKLRKTRDGLQMSDSWLRGDKTRYNRIEKFVGGDPMKTESIRAALRSGRVEKWLVHTDPFGQTSIGILDEFGKLKSEQVSKLLWGKK